MGTAHNIISEWELIHSVDISPLLKTLEETEEEKQKLQAKITKSNTQCPNDKQLNGQAVSLLKLQMARSHDLIDQLIPSHYRTKRGLFNFIGTIQKTFTGTLDAEDGIRYEANFKNLLENQKTLHVDIENHISLTRSLITQTNKTISRLVQNQYDIVKDIKRLEKIIQEISLCNWTKLATSILLLLSEYTNELNDFLAQLITAQTFARHTELHSSIIKSLELQQELQEIKKHLKDASLIMEPTTENIPNYEKLIKVNTYQKKSSIYFILRIPLVETQEYDYYRLYPIPNENQQIIIPETKYVLLNSHTFIELDEPCQQNKNRNFLCEVEILKDIKSKSCPVQLITYDPEPMCKTQFISDPDNQVIKIEETNSWIAVTPTQTTITTECAEQSIKRIQIQGNYLITIPYGCRAKIDSKTLLPKNKEEFQPTPINLPKLKFKLNFKEIKPMTINLTGIDLSQFVTLKQHIDNFQREVHSQKLLGLHDEKINWIQYSIPSILCIFIIISLLHCFLKHKQKIITVFQTKNKPTEEATSKPEENIPLGPF